MNHRKRPAPEPLLPLRAPKQQRTARRYQNTAHISQSVSDKNIFSRWISLGTDALSLVKDTAAHILHGPESEANRRKHTPSSSRQSRRSHSPLQFTRPRRSSSQTSSPELTPRSYVHPFTFSVPSSTPKPPLLALGPGSVIASPKTRQSHTLMGPPPIPHRINESSQLFPKLPASPISSSSRAGSSVRNFRQREHIFAHKHKMNVKREQKKARDEMMKELYGLHRQMGYQSDMNTFAGFMDYRRQLFLRNGARDKDKRVSISTLLPSSLDELKEIVEKGRPRRYSSPDISGPDAAFMRSALEKARATIREPRPPGPFVPTYEQLKLRDRTKDAAIEQRLRPKFPTSLPPDAEAAVDAFFKKRGQVSKYAREAVSAEDIKRLQPMSWLNDEIINFYGAMILGRSEACKENQPKGGPLDVHYFNTFFFQKLEKEGYEAARLAKWTKKFDIFAKDVVLIPVNQSNVHWSGAAINFRKKRIEAYDSMSRSGGGGQSSRIYQTLRTYLDKEHQNKKKKPFDFTGWEDYNPSDTPQQENGCDCGVFTCSFLEALSRGEESFRFSQSSMPYIRRRMVWEIGNAKLWQDP